MAMPKTKLYPSGPYQSYFERQKKVVPAHYSYLVIKRVEEDEGNSCHKRGLKSGSALSGAANQNEMLVDHEFIDFVESKRPFMLHQQTCDLYKRRKEGLEALCLALLATAKTQAAMQACINGIYHRAML